MSELSANITHKVYHLRMLSSSDDDACGPSPCTWLSHAPWVDVSSHRLLRPLCPVCARYCPSQPPPQRRDRRFPGSYLVTGMGSGWLPNTFPSTRGLRVGSFALPSTWTCLTSAQGLPTAYTISLQPSWHHRSRMPAGTWSCLAFATNRLTPAHPFLSVRLLEVDLLLTTRSCSLEADQPRDAWIPGSPG